MAKDKIKFLLSPLQIQGILSELLRKMPPRGKVTANQFTLYRRITNSNYRAMIMFCIHGTIVPTEEGTEVLYFIRPTLPALLLATLLLWGFAHSTVNSFLSHRMNISVWGIAGITVLYFAILFWQMSKCKSKFRAFLIQAGNRVAGNDPVCW